MDDAKYLEKDYGIWGNMRKKFMYAYREADWQLLKEADKLETYLKSINDEYAAKADEMLPSVLLRHGCTEELKAQNSLEWVGRYNMAKNEVKEILQKEIEEIDVDTTISDDEDLSEDLGPDLLPNANSRFA